VGALSAGYSFYALTQVTPPLREPLTVADVHLQSRIDVDDEDILLQGYIIAAREYVETETLRLCRPQVWRLSLQRWPRVDFIQIPLGPVTSILSVTFQDTGGVVHTMQAGVDYYFDAEPQQARIQLPFAGIWPPVILNTASPIQITFQAGYPNLRANVVVTGADVAWTSGDAFDPSLQADVVQIGQQNCVVAAWNSASDLTLAAAPSVQGETTLAYDRLPEKFRQAMRMLIGHWYENRETVITGRSVTSVEIVKSVDALLSMEATHRF